MAKAPEEYYFEDRQISCPICTHKLFWKQKTTMNSRGMLFWELGWLNRDAHTYICEKCGHVLWFMQKG